MAEKLAQAGEGNRHPGLVSQETSKKDDTKENYTKTLYN